MGGRGSLGTGRKTERVIQLPGNTGNAEERERSALSFGPAHSALVTSSHIIRRSQASPAASPIRSQWPFSAGDSRDHALRIDFLTVIFPHCSKANEGKEQ